jgi:hypothetical protein
MDIQGEADRQNSLLEKLVSQAHHPKPLGPSPSACESPRLACTTLSQAPFPTHLYSARSEGVDDALSNSKLRRDDVRRRTRAARGHGRRAQLVIRHAGAIHQGI